MAKPRDTFTMVLPAGTAADAKRSSPEEPFFYSAWLVYSWAGTSSLRIRSPIPCAALSTACPLTRYVHTDLSFWP